MTIQVHPLGPLAGHTRFMAYRAAAIVVMAYLLSACADNSDSVQLPPGPETPIEFALQVTFPLAGSFTGGVDQLSVSGTLEDIAGGDIQADDIAAFEVNGVTPVLDLPAGRWNAVIPAQQGGFDITAVVESLSGRQDSDSLRVVNKAEPLDYDMINVTEDGNTLYVMDRDYGGTLRRIELATLSETQVITDPDAEDSIWAFTGIRTDAAAHTAYLFGQTGEAFTGPAQAFSVDLAEGRAQARGNLPLARGQFEEYPDFDLDEQGQRIVFSFRGDLENEFGDECRLVTLDLVSGETNTLLSEYSLTGSPGEFVASLCPGAVVADAANNRAIVAAEFRDQRLVEKSDFNGIYAYDLQTGERSTIADDIRGSGPPLAEPSRLFSTRANNHVLALDPSGILEVNTVTGDRTMRLADPLLPPDVTDMTYDETNDRLLLASNNNTISALSLETGELAELLRFSRAVGTGPDIGYPAVSVMDHTNQRLLVLESRQNVLIEIDLNTLERKVLAADLGVNDSFRMEISAATLNENGSRLYYAIDKTFIRQTPRSDINVVNLQTGQVERVSSNNLTSGPELKRTRSISLDAARELLYLTGDYYRPARPGVLSVDIATGTRNLLSSNTQGPDQVGKAFSAHLYDSTEDRLIAVTREGAITAINLVNGSRQTLVPLSPGQKALFRNFISWDSEANSVLLLGHYSESYRTDLMSINLLNGERQVVREEVYNFAFDKSRSLFFTLRENRNARPTQKVVALDRYSAGEAVVAHPE